MKAPPATPPALRSALFTSIALQAILFALAGMLLDGGFTAQICVYGAITYWPIAIYILLRKGQPTINDVAFVRSGFPLMCILTALANAFFHRGA